MRIEPDNHVPVYLQIVERLRSGIAAGVYKRGEALPSLRVLALELKVNPNTVQRAFEEMERQGLVESRRGVGMFVAERGAKSAALRAEEAAEGAFEQAVRAAAAAGLSGEKIRELFERAMGGVNGRRRA
ncbi:MAG: GntR family transcriptional regulator [Phycisphaerae bacterium]